MMQQDDDEIALKVIIRRSDLAALKMIAEHEGDIGQGHGQKGNQKKIWEDGTVTLPRWKSRSTSRCACAAMKCPLSRISAA